MAKSNFCISKQISFKISIYLPFLVVFLIPLSKAFSVPSGAPSQWRNSVSPIPLRTRQFLITFIAESEQKWLRMFVLQITIEGSCVRTVWCTSSDNSFCGRGQKVGSADLHRHRLHLNSVFWEVLIRLLLYLPIFPTRFKIRYRGCNSSDSQLHVHSFFRGATEIFRFTITVKGCISLTVSSVSLGDSQFCIKNKHNNLLKCSCFIGWVLLLLQCAAQSLTKLFPHCPCYCIILPSPGLRGCIVLNSHPWWIQTLRDPLLMLYIVLSRPHPSSFHLGKGFSLVLFPLLDSPRAIHPLLV